MPKINVVDMAGKVVSELELNENVFGIEPNKTAMHSVVVNYLANQRQGTQSTTEKQDFAYSIMTLSLIFYRKKEVVYQVSPL